MNNQMDLSGLIYFLINLSLVFLLTIKLLQQD